MKSSNPFNLKTFATLPLVGILTALSGTFSSMEAQVVTVTNDTASTVTVDSGADQTNRTTTFPSWSLNGGNTVAVFFSGEGQDLSSASFGGQAMTIVQETSGSRWTAAIAYLIDPDASTGEIELSWADAVNGTSNQNEVAYTPFALGGVGGVAGSAANDDGSNLVFSYTTTSDGGYVLGAATNNDFRGTNVPAVSGNPDTFEYQSNISGNFSTIHVHGVVTTAGSFTDTYSASESAAAVAFEPGGTPPPAETFALTITPATAPDTGFDLAWESREGKLYNLHTSPDLTGPIIDWDLVAGGEALEATPPTNTFNVDPTDPRRFYAVEEFDAPPPPPVFATDFEENDGGFTLSTPAETAEGSAWEWGAPDSDNGQLSPNDLILTAGASGANAWASNLGTADEGFYTNPTATFLRSPVIDLGAATAATLAFAEAVDFSADDTAEVFVVSDSDDTEIAGPIHTSSIGAIRTAGWAAANGGDPVELPAAALGRAVRLEWRFTGTVGSFLGWYIDDVAVTAE